MLYDTKIIKSWVDAHTNLPPRARWTAKADVALYRATKRASVDPPVNGGFFVQSELDASLVTAYRETEYRVMADRPFALRIDEPCAELLALYKASKLACAAFLSACNPFSKAVSHAENTERQAELISELRRRSLMCLEGFGEHPSGNWPGEASCLVLGLSLEAAKSLGQRYEQNAIVWCGADSIPRLVLLK